MAANVPRATHTRQIPRSEPHQQRQEPVGKHEPQNASGHRQERGLDQHLASELRRPRAERRSNRELASPRRAPREHQAGEIGRDGHDEERDAASEEPQRPADRAEKLVREAMHVGRRRLRGFRVLLPQSLLRRLHFLLQGIRGRPGPEPRKGSDEIVPALGASRIAAQVEGNVTTSCRLSGPEAAVKLMYWSPETTI